jgi:predicted phage terminase large subunit-like protein
MVDTAVEDGRSTPVLGLVERELAQRELARRSLIGLIKRMDPTYKAGWVHHDIAQRLERFSKAVIAGESPRLVIEVPPRHGKSTLASHYFPAFHLGHAPNHEFIITSHTASLAEKFSGKVRDVITDPAYGAVYELTKIDKNRANVTNWLTTRGGGVLAAGVGGPILGSGAHVLVIDDPVKNAEEALSENTQEGIWDWFATTARTRLAPGGGILVIMQRWSDNDLAGMLIKKGQTGEGDLYEVVRYPAIAEVDEQYRKTGEALHPERYPLEQLEALKKTLDNWMWSALYQQSPTVEDGDYFTRDMVAYYEKWELPDDLTYYGAWDFAVSKKETADWTVGIVAGLDKSGALWIVDRYRGRWDSAEIVENLLDCWEAYDFDMLGGEDGQIKLALGPFLEKEAEERGLWDFTLEPLKVGRKDKVLRARSFQGLMRRRRVRFPKNAPWVEDLIRELMQFPNGVNDDQVDACAHLGIMLQQMSHIAKIERKQEKDSPYPFERKWQEHLKQVMGTGSRTRDWRAA